MDNKTALTIGIPAYNEQANIKNLLISLLSQKADNFELKEIIVYSDASTDNTIAEIKSLNDPRIKIIEGTKRKGQSGVQNELLREFKTDILILLNADMLPSNHNFLSLIIEEFRKDPKLSLVFPEIIPVRASTYFEKVINFSVHFKKNMYRAWNGGNNLYLCCGVARGLSKEFAKTLKWPTSSSEDAYSFLECKIKNNKFAYLPSAVANYKSPDNFADHMKQSTRFLKGKEVMYNYFPKNFVDENYDIPSKIKLGASIKFLFKDPIKFLSYTVIFLICKVRSHSQTLSANANLWEPSNSSKKII
jgi:cellulose synthase/poly-beta-1,6-N-acetylglucosamine synthase-like glycosyltransferase